MHRLSCLIVLCAITVSPAEAGKYNQVLKIGDQAPAWNELPGVDGSRHSFSDLEDAAAVVVVFTCNSCPYAVDAEDRLVALQEELSKQKVALVAINVNKIDEDALPAMKEKADEKGFQFPYLFDESQKIARDYGAMFTPEFFVINRQRQIVYMGAMDDSPDGRAVTKSYVRSAVEAALDNKLPEIQETPPIGCGVRYERVRRRRRATKP